MLSGLPVEAVEFASPAAETVSEDGVVGFAWEEPAETTDFELQQATAADFSDAKVRYHGPDRGSVITGLGEGTYFFRVRAEGSKTWSAPVKVEVRYMDMGLVWALMGVGVFMFGATVTAIVRGHYEQEVAS